MDFQTLALDIRDGVALLHLNQPATLNSLSISLVHELRSALKLIQDRSDVSALVLSGTGRGFCTGAELGSMQVADGAAQSVGQRAADWMRDAFNPLISDLHNFPLPVVAAVNGVAAGAGVSLALAADVTIAARSATFILTFTPRLGLIPDMGATWQLPRLVGAARARGMALLGDRIAAATAADWGLIWQCVDDAALISEAQAVARRLAAMPSHAATELRAAFDAAEGNTLDAQLEYERQRQQILLDKEDFREGVSAFLEKREPVFRRVRGA